MVEDEFDERIASEEWGRIKDKYKDHYIGADKGIIDRLNGRRSDSEPRWSALTFRFENFAFLGMAFMITHLVMLLLPWEIAAPFVFLSGVYVCIGLYLYVPFWRFRDEKTASLIEMGLLILGVTLAVIL